MADTAESIAMQAVNTTRVEAPGGEIDTEDAVRAMRLALHAANVTLPDLSSEDCACGLIRRAALVELGSVSATTAVRLAELIAKGALAELSEARRLPARNGGDENRRNAGGQPAAD